MMDSSSAGPLNAAGADCAKYPYLAALNPAQLKAVTAPPSTPLQILAGPGSGKTRVLTSRVAYLVQHHAYRPQQIVCVTFTNKAAREMGKRLEVLLGDKVAGGLVLGTFHALCARYLRIYGGMINLQNNFTIFDADDSKKTMSRLLKAKSEYLEAAGFSLKDSAVLSEISKAKVKGEDPDGMAVRAARDPVTSTNTLAVIAELYEEYQAALQESNSLDFDDLLVFGLRLFRSSSQIIQSCRHILVDEFQDTNTTQYELMRSFTQAHGGVSVVGDPDQSIYGWRSAEIENLNKMTEDFTDVEAVYLEENYRSTGSILAAAHSVVSQDRERIPKNLYTSHPRSTPVSLKVFAAPVIEASFISTEIKRLIAYSGGVLNYGDFAVLLRTNALSRVIESVLQKDSIPNRIIGGHKFFERMEIKDLLAYLQLAENPDFAPAFVRVVNVPRRAIGDKSVADLLSAARAGKVSAMELCESIIDGDKLPDGIKPAVKRNLASFVGVVKKLRRAAERGKPVADLIRMTIEKTGYEEYLKTSQQDADSRWENVQELISFSVTVVEEQLREGLPEEVEGFTPASSATVEAMVDRGVKKEGNDAEKRIHPLFRRASAESRSRSGSVEVKQEKNRKSNSATNSKSKKGKMQSVIEVLSSDEEPNGNAEPRTLRDDADLDVDSELAKADMTPLSYFLQTSMLSTDTDADKADESSKLKVTLTTVHAAKGLEWPVVFVPAVEQGTFPSRRCTEAHEIAEERRLLYVAMTRAQLFLTMSHCYFRMMGGEENDRVLSEFVQMSKKKDPAMFTADMPDVDLAVRRNMAKMLGRSPPDEEQTKELIRKHIRAAPPLSMWDPPEPRDKQFNRFARRDVTKAARGAEYWASEHDEYALPDASSASYSGFASARAAQQQQHQSSRLSKPYNMPPRSPQKPVVKLPQRDHGLRQAMPFTFGITEAKKRDADLGMFTNSSTSSLAMMRGLGLPGDLDLTSEGSSPNLNGARSPKLGSSPNAAPATFESLAKGAVSDWKSLAQPDTGGIGDGNAVGSNGMQLAKGTKRLGMGRPAPWGAKRAKEG